MQWTRHREQFLRDNYESMDDEQLAAKLGCTPKAVWHKRQKLGLLRDKSTYKRRKIVEKKPAVIPRYDPRYAPLCKCGCGEKTPWDVHKGTFRVYVNMEHYHRYLQRMREEKKSAVGSPISAAMSLE